METNWSAVSAIVSVLTLFGVVGVGGTLWGALSERVSAGAKWRDEHEIVTEKQDSRLNDHDVKLAALAEWKAGYNAAAQIGRHTPEV